MNNIFLKLFTIFAFILTFAIGVNAADLGINSVTYDNSGSFLIINSFDSEEFNFSSQPKAYIIPEENKLYFDINSAVLKCPVQNLVVTTPEIKEIKVSQFSTNPNIVRVVINYMEDYNPSNIKLLRNGNTFFIRFKNTTSSNFYFQPIYSESDPTEFYESTIIQYPVTVAQNSMLSQINSAFKLGDTTDSKNYILAKKDLTLPTKFYVDNVTSNNGNIVLTGVGSVSLIKPIFLSNPSRVVYDLPNSYVNPSIRNKDFAINDLISVKIGQFTRTTARVVITAQSPERFIPIIYGDTQRIVFADKNTLDANSISSVKANLTSAYDEISDVNTHSIKLIFSKPLIMGVDRNSSELNLYLYNVDNYDSLNIKSSILIDDIKLTNLKKGGVKFTIPGDFTNIYDMHLGGDAKTLRIKAKIHKPTLQEIAENETIIVVEPIEPVKTKRPANSKKYIVIDPGHGGADCGAIREGINEKDITIDVSHRVEKLLEKKGYIVKMTRVADETVSLQERVDFSEEIDPDIFISIHVNSSNSDAPNGIETHYYKDNSLTLAKNIHASMLNHINAHDRGLFKSKFYVINHTTAPAILVEIGFLSNPEERLQVVSESRKQATAKAIAEGINDYFKQQKK